MQTLGLDVVFPAFFAVLLVDELHSSERAPAAGLLGGALTAGLLLVLPTGPALLGGLRRGPDRPAHRARPAP